MREAGFDDLHDLKGSKFFSFSNLIPPSKTVQGGSRRSLIIASPSTDLVKGMRDEAERLIGSEINIGPMRFQLQGSEIFEARIPDEYQDCGLVTGTPIVLRIPRYRLQEYEITPARGYDYVYWRKEHTPTVFIKQLEENLIKKYNQYHRSEVENSPMFERLRFNKQVAVPLRVRGKETTIIGTLWEFPLPPLDDMKREILQFGLDAGLGEMNSLGFGFMNLMKANMHGEEVI